MLVKMSPDRGKYYQTNNHNDLFAAFVIVVVVDTNVPIPFLRVVCVRFAIKESVPGTKKPRARKFLQRFFRRTKAYTLDESTLSFCITGLVVFRSRSFEVYFSNFEIRSQIFGGNFLCFEIRISFPVISKYFNFSKF